MPAKLLSVNKDLLKEKLVRLVIPEKTCTSGETGWVSTSEKTCISGETG